MFLDSSRYARVPQEVVTTRDGRAVAALVLRRLPPTTGDPYAVRDDDRLDVLAHGRFADGTHFWRIADANTALEARALVAQTGDVVAVPGVGTVA